MAKRIVRMLLTTALVFSAPLTAKADGDTRIEEILAVNPGLTRAAFDSSVDAVAEQEGVSSSAVIDIMYADSANARANQRAAENASPKAGGDSTKPTLSDEATMLNSGGSEEAGTTVKLGCASAGYYTYSYSTNYNVRHGHNTLFTANCAGVHMPGGTEVYIRAITSDYKGLKTHTNYPAHVRRVVGGSSGAHTRAAAFGTTNVTRTVQYNSNFAVNKTAIWQTHYDCSSLVWAAWMYATESATDLDYNGGLGVYPEDLWKSPLTAVNRYLVEA